MSLALMQWGREAGAGGEPVARHGSIAAGAAASGKRAGERHSGPVVSVAPVALMQWGQDVGDEL